MANNQRHHIESMDLLRKDEISPFKVCTWAVTIPLNDKHQHPYETYVMCGTGKDFDSCTVCHKSRKDAEKYHDLLCTELRRIISA